MLDNAFFWMEIVYKQLQYRGEITNIAYVRSKLSCWNNKNGRVLREKYVKFQMAVHLYEATYVDRVSNTVKNMRQNAKQTVERAETLYNRTPNKNSFKYFVSKYCGSSYHFVLQAAHCTSNVDKYLTYESFNC